MGPGDNRALGQASVVGYAALEETVTARESLGSTRGQVPSHRAAYETDRYPRSDRRLTRGGQSRESR